MACTPLGEVDIEFCVFFKTHGELKWVGLHSSVNFNALIGCDMYAF